MCATTRRSTRENIELYRHENESLRESSKRISLLEVENAALTQKVEVSSILKCNTILNIKICLNSMFCSVFSLNGASSKRWSRSPLPCLLLLLPRRHRMPPLPPLPFPSRTLRRAPLAAAQAVASALSGVCAYCSRITCVCSANTRCCSTRRAARSRYSA